ncbi:MAG: hypothetical protein LPL29_12580 [Alphaproteobacteria bacterium]|nr:hypothetical protein [Alphaproteobacteria bacterium]MDX5416450.1 hypothetical protein [Alphaproteobacteria bacterium]
MVRSIRHLDRQALLAKQTFCLGLGFFLTELIWGGAMTATTYGYPAYDIDAEIWATGQMVGAASVLYGLIINGRWPRWSPMLRVGGWALLTWMFSYLAASAAFAEDGRHITLVCLVLFVPFQAYYAAANFRDWWERAKYEPQ